MIRPAESHDIEALLLLGWEMHQESRYSALDYSVEKVAALFSKAISEDGYLLLVVEVNSEIVGAFFGYISKQWFGEDLISGDFGLFMLPDHRGKSHSVRLVRKYIKWAQANGVKNECIGLGITTGVSNEMVSKLYRKLGFNDCGLIMNLKGSV